MSQQHEHSTNLCFPENVSRCTEKKSQKSLHSDMYLDIMEQVTVDISVLKAVFNAQYIINAYVIIDNNI